ncbi:MAG: DUF5663 domain-containing protein [Candidatus Portnoybacteria bacterium]|nr:DUF5663 domain-containing protein [Candidatus Portnoybacteria bacterium]MDD4982397.1 DUF5663 domain-containing protein [Candidatus Portnoybacteria bacterium]
MNIAEFLLPGMPTQIEENIFQELGIAELPQERQEEVLTAMTEAVLKRITLRLIGALAEEKKSELEALGEDTEKISQFLAANIPNHEELVKEEVANFKQDMQKTVDSLLV